MNQLDMKGRGAIVTGGAAGIGLAIAQRLVASGARVSLWDRDAAALDAAAQCARRRHPCGGGRRHARRCRRRRRSRHRLAALKRIDALVCSAGITGPNTTVEKYPLAAWKEVIDINLTGALPVQPGRRFRT